ncbi:thymidylate kinase-domain-containing protein, partial [Xylaria arbuscula]
MASINDLATAATIASSAVALQSSPKEQSTRPSSPSSQPQEDPPSPPSPSPSAQLQLQAQEAHAQRIVSASASRSPVPEVSEPDPAPRTPPGATTAAAAAPASSSSGPDSSSIVVNAGGGGVSVSVTTPNTPTPTPTPGPVLAAPQISQNPAQATIPPQPSPETTPENGEGAVEREDEMDGIEYEGEQKEPPVRGAFIVFEGMDRAGKTTQAKLLQLRCIESGREVKFMRFPDRTTPIGQMIDSYLKGEAEIGDHVIHLLFSANRWEAAQKIRTELEAGHTIICDRFYHSGIVYSAAKQLPSLSLSWAKAPEVGLPRPDMVLFLDLEESVARSRGGWGGEVYEKGEMQRRVRELFWGLSLGDLGTAVSASKAANGKGPSRSERTLFGNGTNSSTARDREGGDAEAEGEFRQEEEDIQIVDADVGVEELADKVWEIVRGRIEAVERGEEGRAVRTV